MIETNSGKLKGKSTREVAWLENPMLSVQSEQHPLYPSSSADFARNRDPALAET
jgi:hypothetical protein